jgi:isoquinoline 1-oxidoreductase beta subunit
VAAIPSLPQISELFDLEDLQTDAALPTSRLITITVGTDGRAAFALPRMEVGHGLPMDMVDASLAPARPELMFTYDRRLEYDCVDVHADPGRCSDRP